MSATILPTNTQPTAITKLVINPTFVIGTTTGLVKQSNEDRLGCRQNDGTIRVCIADGHWGDAAADSIVAYWLDESIPFPAGRKDAVAATGVIERTLYEQFGNANMDETRDFTPEASFIVAQIQNDRLSIVSYGDCRLIVAAQGAVRFELETASTWLGAFSHLGLRDRLSIRDCLVFEQLTLSGHDQIMLFTDGVDECVYEHPTLSNEQLVQLCDGKQAGPGFDAILAEVLAHGAEDNASLALYHVQPPLATRDK